MCARSLHKIILLNLFQFPDPIVALLAVGQRGIWGEVCRPLPLKPSFPQAMTHEIHERALLIFVGQDSFPAEVLENPANVKQIRDKLITQQEDCELGRTDFTPGAGIELVLVQMMAELEHQMNGFSLSMENNQSLQFQQ